MNYLPKNLYLSLLLAVNVFAFAMLGWGSWSVYQRYQTGFTPTLRSQVLLKEQKSRTPNIKLFTVVGYHLFGKKTTTVAESAVIVNKAAPQTKLKLSLLGVIASDQQNLAHAIIATKGGRAGSYAIGSTIRGTDALIQAINERNVTLLRQGVIESLALETTQAKNSDLIGPVLMSDSQPPASPANPMVANRTIPMVANRTILMPRLPSSALPNNPAALTIPGAVPNQPGVLMRPSEIVHYMGQTVQM